jgi:hypothetical protein
LRKISAEKFTLAFPDTRNASLSWLHIRAVPPVSESGVGENKVKKLICCIFVMAVSVSAVSGKAALNSKFPIVKGTIKVTKEWSINLPENFNRRFEEGSMVLWKPEFTIWVNIWENDKNKNPYDQLDVIRRDKSKDAFDIIEIRDDGLYRYGYRIDEKKFSGKEIVYAFYGYVAGKSGYTQIAFYYDNKTDYEAAKAIWLSIKEL